MTLDIRPGGPGQGHLASDVRGETVMSEYGGNGDPAHSSESQALRRGRWIIKFNGLLDQSM